MIKVIAKNFLKAEHIAEAAPLFREMIAATVVEDGCIEYSLFIDTKNPTAHVFVEAWESQAALDAHMQTEHFTRLIPQIGAMCEKPMEVVILDAFQ